MLLLKLSIAGAVYIIAGITFFPLLAAGQHPMADVAEDTAQLTLTGFFTDGQVHGHFRNYFMATVNNKSLSDYGSNAVGGALHYETRTWKGLSLGVAGIFSYRTFSSDLLKRDNISGRKPAWEPELYDIQRPEEGQDLDRLEELWIVYRKGNSYLRLGKQNINEGPLLLEMDGRMKPFVYRGLWLKLQEWEGHAFTAGCIDQVSPRGVTEWLALNEAIGMLNNGALPNGEPADYGEHANTGGMAVFNYTNTRLPFTTIQYWNYYLDNVTDINWLQVDYERGDWLAGMQWVYQVPDSHQHTLTYNSRYMHPEEKGIVASVQAGLKGKHITWTVAALRSFGEGRFLYPRELGRDAFYVSQPRARLDGLGNTNVLNLKAHYRAEAAERGLHGLAWTVQLSRWNLPAMDSPLNKYQKPGFYQATVDVAYHFSNMLKGLELRLLYVGRYTPGLEAPDLKEQFYTTNLHHFNLVTNINF